MDKFSLLKSHIEAYTRKDGSVVAAHDDKRVAVVPEGAKRGTVHDITQTMAGYNIFHIKDEDGKISQFGSGHDFKQIPGVHKGAKVHYTSNPPAAWRRNLSGDLHFLDHISKRD